MELEKQYDNLHDQLRNSKGCPDRIGIMITKEIIQAQLTELQRKFDDDKNHIVEPNKLVDNIAARLLSKEFEEVCSGISKRIVYAADVERILREFGWDDELPF